MIIIGKPRIVRSDEKARLVSLLTIDGNEPIKEEVFYEVDKKYEPYLCDERGDAFVVALLNYAMVNGHDITSEAPIGEFLLYHLERYLIDALKEYNPSWHRSRIIAHTDKSVLPNAHAVGTGISCGVDSCYALAMESDSNYPSHKLTHLMFNNVGSHGEGQRARQLFEMRSEGPRKIAKELGLEIILGDSNLMDVVKQDHFHTHTYSSVFPILCLQKLFSVYYYASGGYKYDDFTLRYHNKKCCGTYEVLSLPLFSTDTLRIYSQGENKTRMQKLKEVIKYEPSYRYLNVCLKDGENCGKCEKCIRTLLALDVLGALDRYRKVFNVDYYLNNRKWYYEQMMDQIVNGKKDYFEIYYYLKKDIPLWMVFKYKVYKKSKDSIYNFFNRYPRIKSIFKPVYHTLTFHR